MIYLVDQRTSELYLVRGGVFWDILSVLDVCKDEYCVEFI